MTINVLEISIYCNIKMWLNIEYHTIYIYVMRDNVMFMVDQINIVRKKPNLPQQGYYDQD